MAEEVEKRIQEQVEDIIRRCEKVVNDFDKKGINADIKTKSVLYHELDKMIKDIENHHLPNYRLTLKGELSDQERNDLLDIIKKREKYLKRFKDCQAALLRIH